MRELKIKIVIEKSQKLLSEISNSVGPDSSTVTSLSKVDIFLRESKKEARELPKKEEKLKKYFAFLSIAIAPFLKELLSELWAKAVTVIRHLGRV